MSGQPASSRQGASGRHGTSARSGTAARFRPRRLAIANGETLVLGGDGTIERRDPAGATLARWLVDDPAWADHALRFGVRTSPVTVAPHGRDVPGNTLPG
jgi:hypothetical protein